MNTPKTYTEISTCRVCGCRDMTNVVSLGEQSLTGVFPRNPDAQLTKGPLDLVLCGACSLLQLRQSYNLEEMYGDNYGYRSGLNASMVAHLQQKIRRLEHMANVRHDDLVIDIGSNDATSLKAYTRPCQRLGIDPTGLKFRAYYPDDIALIPDFFSASDVLTRYPSKRARIVTSISMFYDLEQPLAFAKDVASVLADDGLWHFEQSYMPSMLRTNAYDTICHEHLEFYSFKVVQFILRQCGMRVVDVETNGINGGSFAVTACKENAPFVSNRSVIEWLLRQEEEMQLATVAPYVAFAERMRNHRQNLRDLLNALVADGKKILGYGASTKGNVLLQYCGIGVEHLPCIAEVNEDKFGAYTPGTNIPIVSEAEARAMKPDYFFVLPWHFKAGILEREKNFREQGGKFIFPLPEIEIIS